MWRCDHPVLACALPHRGEIAERDAAHAVASHCGGTTPGAIAAGDALSANIKNCAMILIHLVKGAEQ